MKVIKPIRFQESQLVSTTAVEIVPTWDSATTYAKDALAVYPPNVYKSLVASNTGNTPSLTSDKWVKAYSDNTHAMFDDVVGTRTEATVELTVAIQPGDSINALAILNCEGTSVTITQDDSPGGQQVYSKTVNLDNTQIVDWLMYFFENFDLAGDAVVTDLPMYRSGVVTVTITGPVAAIGSIIYGKLYEIGASQYGARTGIRDYSIKQTNEYGHTAIIERTFSNRMEVEVEIPNNKMSFVKKFLTDIRATPSVWIASDCQDFRSLILHGVYKDFGITVEYPSQSLCSLELEGLT